jgi:hypothetical protein
MADLAATVRQCPLASAAGGGGCYSLGYSVASARCRERLLRTWHDRESQPDSDRAGHGHMPGGAASPVASHSRSCGSAGLLPPAMELSTRELDGDRDPARPNRDRGSWIGDCPSQQGPRRKMLKVCRQMLCNRHCSVSCL